MKTQCYGCGYPTKTKSNPPLCKGCRKETFGKVILLSKEQKRVERFDRYQMALAEKFAVSC